MGLREEKKEQQRQAILETAMGLFRERGFEQTRVQDVTDRLRISEATFFNYFPTKQSVLEAAAVDLLDRTMALLHDDVENDGRPVSKRLESLVRSFATHFAGDREFAGLLALNAQLWLLRRQRQETYGLLTRLLDEGQRRGEIRKDLPASQLAEMFIAVVLVTISNWLLAPGDDGGGSESFDEDPLDERLLRAWRVLSDGATAPSRSGRLIGTSRQPRPASPKRRTV
jgi:AcrR family transcriptional regulator